MRSDSFYYVGSGLPRWYGSSKRPTKPRKTVVSKSLRKRNFSLSDLTKAVREFAIANEVSNMDDVKVRFSWGSGDLVWETVESQEKFLAFQADWDTARERFKVHTKNYHARVKREEAQREAKRLSNQVFNTDPGFVIVKMSTADYAKLKKL